MDHNDIRHKLSEHIDGTVTDQDKTDIEAHLKSCEQCSNALAELRKTIEYVKTVEEVDPPVWMTQKIMAKVREGAEAKETWFRRFFFPLQVKLPLQAVAVLFLAVTAFYIHRNIQPTKQLPETPDKEFDARKEAPPASITADKLAKTDESTLHTNKGFQTSNYRALDIKQKYEKPAPPVPQMQAMAPEPAKKAEQPAAMDNYVPAPQVAAPNMMQEQAVSAEGSALRTEAKQEFVAKNKAMRATKSDTTQSDVDTIKTLQKYFAAHDLPKDLTEQGVNYSAYKIPEGLPNLEWLDASTRNALISCMNKYKIEADISKRKRIYFYCLDDSAIKPLDTYEQKNEKWINLR